jgi:hypothetical protein
MSIIVGNKTSTSEINSVNVIRRALCSEQVAVQRVHRMENENNATGSRLILTSKNTTVVTPAFRYDTFIPPIVGESKKFVIETSVSLTNVIKCNCIDLQGDELTAYVKLDATFLTANGGKSGAIGRTSVDNAINGTGTTINFDTNGDVRWINSIELSTGSLSFDTGPFVYVYTFIGADKLYTQMLAWNYLRNPIFCCPNGYKAHFKGITYMSNTEQTAYGVVVYRIDDRQIRYGTTFPYRGDSFTSIMTKFTYGPSPVILNPGDFMTFNRETASATLISSTFHSYLILIPK